MKGYHSLKHVIKRQNWTFKKTIHKDNCLYELFCNGKKKYNFDVYFIESTKEIAFYYKGVNVLIKLSLNI